MTASSQEVPWTDLANVARKAADRVRRVRESSWLTETVLTVVARAAVWPSETIEDSLAELRRIADEDPDPTTGGAILRICDAIEGVYADK